MRSIGEDHSATRQKNGQWTPEEDRLLMKYIETYGEGKWRTLPQKAGLQRCGKGCRLRWKNYLRPNVKRGNISLEEEDLIIRLHKLLGNRWSLIAGRVPGRTDNEIKNYWNSHLSKKLRCKDNLEDPNHFKVSSSPLDPLQLHSYEKDLINSEILNGYNYSSLPDCKMDYLNSQRQEDYLKRSHFDISHITDSQIDPSGHMACAFQPHTPREDSSKRFSHCQYADCFGNFYSSQFLSAKHDVGFSIEACLQQPLPPQGHFSEINGYVFQSMVAMQPKCCSPSSLRIVGSHGQHDEICDHNGWGSTEMHDSIATDIGEFGAQSMNSILGLDIVHDNLNFVEQKPCHDLRTDLQVMHPIISLCEHSEQCTNDFYIEDKADAFAQVTEMNATTIPMTCTSNF